MLDRTKNTLYRLYHTEGKSLVEMGALYGRSPGTVWGWLKKRGIPTRSVREGVRNRPSTVTEADVERMQELYSKGMSSNDIGALIGRDGRTVRAHLKLVGIMRDRETAVRLAVESGKIRSKDVQVNDSFFDTMTSASAWVLGLLLGDGHLTPVDNVMYLAGTEQVCRNVADLIEHERGPRPHNQGADCWVLRWSSWRMVQTLESLGVKRGAKAKIITFPTVPDLVLPDLFRGLWDADGGWGRRGASLRANYACSSKAFVDSMSGVLLSLGWEPKTREHVTNLNGKEFVGYRIELKAAHSRELAQWLYESSTPEIRCERKYRTALPGGVGKFSPQPPVGGDLWR